MQLFDAELLGIAIVLAASLGYYSSLRTAASAILREEKRFTPRKRKTLLYDSLFRQYCEIRTAVSPHF
jgi:ribulose kinase